MSKHTPEPLELGDQTTKSMKFDIAENEKADFAVRVLKQYALENQIPARSTSDLSPMEEWLILRLFEALQKEVEQLRADRERLIQALKELIYGDPSFVVDEYWTKQLLSEIEDRK